MVESSPSVPGLVSIIVPAYRAERFLDGALDSVRRQRYPSWELIVVEDGSQGSTQARVEAFAREFPERRVVYLRHEQNRGLGATRNTAIQAAQGEFLALLDADDLWLESHLAAAVERLAQTSADVAYSTAVKFEDQTGLLLGVWGPTRRDLDQFPRSLVRRNFVTPSATVLRRRVVATVGLFSDDRTIHMCEDIDYWLRAVEAGLQFVHVPGCHCLYRKGAAEAGSTNPLPIVERQVWVLQRHRGTAGIPVSDWDRALTYYRTAAGMLHWEQDGRRAAPWFWAAWRGRPWRIDLLLVSVLCRTVCSLLPNLGIIRRINRAIRPQ